MSKRRDAPVRAKEVLKRLKKAYPEAGCELQFSTPLELLVATILSAQCSDARVNGVTPRLFKNFRSAKAYAKASADELENFIRPTGFYRNKAKSIRNCCAQIVLEHGGELPQDMAALTQLPGVGRKTANLIRSYVFGLPGIICDTHVIRVSGRLGLTAHKVPEKIETDLMQLVPKKSWTDFSTLLMWHGRRCCSARKPSCDLCLLRDLCPYSASA